MEPRPSKTAAKARSGFDVWRGWERIVAACYEYRHIKKPIVNAPTNMSKIEPQHKQ
jgi:hypothetical protein